ncbi:S8 family serine peptidase [Sungkyunkwania multivorans]|uniref:S8 family serine peptidase n=1 Tax=Sungkyunkwania multivorans TaxID=1173618 RepID=A0ABW3D0A5_9FLAO
MRLRLPFSNLAMAFLLASTFVGFAQTQRQKEQITSRYDKTTISQLHNKFSEQSAKQKEQALKIAKQKGWPIKLTLEDGSFTELQRVAFDGSPIYYSTRNVAAARSTRADHLNIGGSLGLDLDGQNMTAHVWDGGHARVTHQEYDGPGGNDRVTIIDAASEGGTQLNFHAAHVTGTIMASGVQANAKGMAPQAKVRGSMWNDDVAEATAETSNGMLLSNHSYGFRSDLVPDQYFGAYIDESRNWDEVMYNAPYYLMVVAAGNDGNSNYNGQPLDGQSAYDKLTGHSVSKNNMVVANAQDANIDSNGNLVSVTINSSSSEGPTDDYRIKPDITGNGTSVYSTYHNSNTAYNSITGTSMASPNVTGSLLLLQQHANNTFGNFMRASTLKGLALHTADDVGATGPDPVYGWGLMNTKRAAEAISAQPSGDAIIDELTLTSGQSYTINVDADGVNDLVASISWTDVPGTATTATNSTTARLVNDLDIRVAKGGTTYFPWRLTGVTTNGLGDNTKDPYERITVGAASGSYTITITHKGSLSGGSQNYSLIVTGITGTPVQCTATTPTGVSTSNVGSGGATVSWNSVQGASYDVRYRATGTTTWTTIDAGATSATLSGLNQLTQYEAQVRSKCSDGSTSGYSGSVTFTTTEVQLNYCASNGNSVADEYISNVKIGSIDNTSGAASSGYADFTAQATDLEKGASATITVTPTWTGTLYNEGYSVWIDYNQDGDFADSGEQVWTSAPSQTTPVSGSFTVPSTAIDGTTRMRVSMKYNAIPTACESFQYGEVEDYTVNITEATADTEAPTAPASLAASNVADTTLTLTWNASNDNVGVTGYDVYEGGSLIGSVAVTTANVTGLTANTAYSFSVKAKDAAGNESAFSNTVNVTTTGGSGGGCTGGIASYPYSESFENTLGAWSQDTGDSHNWTVRSGGTPSNGTGPSGASDGSYYIYVEASDPNFNKTAILNSPCFNLAGLSQGFLSFKYQMNGNAVGTLKVEASLDDGTTWNSVFTKSGSQGSAWLTASVDLAGYVGSATKLRLVVNTTGSWQGDIAIDALSISDTPPATDICEGVAPWSSSQSYQVGDRVTYQGFLYERTASGWDNLGACGTTASTQYTTYNDISDGPIAIVLSPNPVAGSELFIGTNATMKFRIVNTLGQKVREGVSNDGTIDVSSLQVGVYIVELNNDLISVNKRFVKE